MMGHYVFAVTDGGYVSTRKNNGRMYESRPTESATLDGARVFNTSSAAKNAAVAFGVSGVVIPVDLTLCCKD